MAARFRLGVSTVHQIIKNTYEAIWVALSGDYLPEPTQAEWKIIEHGFREKWNFPNCTGALDSKHIQIQSPAKSGSLYFNYKDHFSLVLMALVDADYRFTFVDIGDYGSNADGSIFKNSIFGQRFLTQDLDILDPKPLPGFH